MLTLPEPGFASEAERTDEATDATDEPRREALDGVVMQLVRTLKLVQWATHTMTKDAPSDELDLVAYRLLARVIIDGPTRLTVLADAMHSDTSTVSRQTSALVKAGLLERKPDAADGRACLLAATEAGNGAVQRYRRSRGERLARMLDDWPDDDVERFAALLERFNGTLEQYHADADQAAKTNGPRSHHAAGPGDNETIGEGEDRS